MNSLLTAKDVRRVARRTIETLERGNYRCAVFGSLACSDVDIVVFSRHDREVIKAYIAAHHDRFSLEDAKTPGADVDILTSGRNSPIHTDNPPTVHLPLLALLILKVQGWRDHSKISQCRRFRAKIPQDIEDIRQLLDMADDAGDRLSELRGWSPQWFLNRAENLVTRYTNNFNETTYLFRILGFDV
ncbi:hypothetical protein F5887DRAFT_999658 [Amanita rubescens]|nr:hypothetical protein F5887DRAFT_999658 [Amanita rubescens]